jgi:PAS domain S-box-containing protein
MSSEALDPELATRLFRVAPVGIALIVAPGTIAWANPAYFETTGRGQHLVGIDFHDIMDLEGTWSPTIRTAMDTALRSRVGTSFRSIRADHRGESREVYFDVDIRPLERKPDEPVQALLMVRDVTDRVEQHDRARLFYESFRTSSNPMELTDAKGVLLDVNPAFERTYGYTRAECIGQTPRLVRSPQTSAELYRDMWEVLLDPARGSWSGELNNRDRAGRESPVLLTITAIRNGSGTVTHFLGAVVDVSELRRLEFEAVHADKLASIGRLAAGVAHEINTPLANIMMIAESLRMHSSDPFVLGRLGTMCEQIDVAAVIVGGLLDFARREPPHMSELDLVDVARSSVVFLKGKQSGGVEIEESYPPRAVRVLGDRGQLIQVLTNVLNNAYDAMNGHGSLRISVGIHGDRGEVEVVDQGPGILPEALPQVFEPFFTTKPEGEGTGLGLAISHGIVLAHHGEITARNVPGAGAGVLISLPLRPLEAPHSIPQVAGA